MWAIQTRDVIAPDGLLQLPYAASPSPVLLTLIQTFSTPVYSECIMISRNMSAFHPLTASKSGKVSLSLVGEWTLLNLPTMAARRSTQDHRHQNTGRYRHHYQNDTVDRDYNGFHCPPVGDSSGRNFQGPRERLHQSHDYGRDNRDHYQSGSRPGYQPDRNSLRRLGPLPRHLRGGAPLDTSGVSSHNQPREARAVPSPPPIVRRPTSTEALDLQAILDDEIVLDDLHVREPNVNNNTPGQPPPPPQTENLSMSVSGNTSTSDTQGTGSDLDQQHDSSGSNAAPAVDGAEASQPSAPAAAGAKASQLSANRRSNDKRKPDGTPLEGHPAHLTEEDITFMNQMLKEWTILWM